MKKPRIKNVLCMTVLGLLVSACASDMDWQVNEDSSSLRRAQAINSVLEREGIDPRSATLGQRQQAQQVAAQLELAYQQQQMIRLQRMANAIQAAGQQIQMQEYQQRRAYDYWENERLQRMQMGYFGGHQ